MGLFERIPDPDSNEVDRYARDRAAFLLRRFVAGQLTNDEFEDEMPVTADPVIGAIWDTAYLFYDDAKAHTLSGNYRLHPDVKRGCVRWILFLDSDLKYEWPDIEYAGSDPGASPSISFVDWLKHLLGAPQPVSPAAEFEAAGNYAVWPFASQHDFRQALRNPRRLNGLNKSK